MYTSISKVKTILVVDDENTNYCIVKSLLDNMKILHASNGKECVKIVQSQHVDIILMDYDMPEMDGLEAAKEVKKINPYLPVIMHTANLQSDFIKKMKNQNGNVNDFLFKPACESVLRAIVKKYAG